MNTEYSPATGAHTTDGIPHGYSTLTPFLPLNDPASALAFYQEVLGATVVGVTSVGDTIVHAELDLGNGRLQLGAASADHHTVAIDPDSDDATFSLGHYCNDVDGVVSRAVEAGALLREPVADFASGDRYGSIRDPFGVRWSIMTRVQDLSDDESALRVREWIDGMNGG